MNYQRKTTNPDYLRALQAGNPNDHLRALLLERMLRLSNSEIARAHAHAYADSTLAITTVARFRWEEPQMGERVTPLMAEAIAAATGSTPEDDWEEAFRRWREAMK